MPLHSVIMFITYIFIGKGMKMKKKLLGLLMIFIMAGLIACNNQSDNDYRYTRLSDFDYMIVRNGSLQYGYIDSEFNEIIPCQFKSATLFHNNLAIVSNSQYQYGIINLSGEYVVEPQYDSIEGINEFHYFVVEKDGLYALMNSQGIELTDFLYAQIKLGEDESIVAVMEPETEKWGYINLQGNEVIDFMYDKVYAYNGRSLTAVQINDRWRLIDYRGNYINSSEYENVYMSSDEYVSVKLDDMWGLIDGYGQYIIPIEYDFYFRFNEYGLSPIRLDGLYGFVNLEGEIEEDMVYTSDEYRYFPMSLSFPSNATFQKDLRYYLFDYEGNSIFSSVRYRPIEYNSKIILAEDMVNHENVVINYNSRVIGKANEDYNYKVLPYFENFFFAEHFVEREDGNLYVSDVYNYKGDLLTENQPAKYDRYITDFTRAEYIPVEFMDLGLYALIDIKGNVLLQPEYRWIRIFDDGFIIVKKGTEVAILDADLNVLLDYHYTDIIYYE